MHSTSKGDELEDAFYSYLLDQRDRGELVFGVYTAQNCKIYKKKSYYCRERGADVEFDVVIELYRTGSETPHLYVIFECKNHEASISKIYINDFSSKIGRIFPHASKGIIVTNSRLQSGAEMVARNSAMGIVKFDEHGLEIIADRKARIFESGFLRAQMFRKEDATKSLKFSAFYGGKYFAGIDDLVSSLDPDTAELSRPSQESAGAMVPFLSREQIKSASEKILDSIGYVSMAQSIWKKYANTNPSN